MEESYGHLLSCDLIDGCEFSRGLNVLDGIALGRISNTQAVNGKGAVSVVVDSDIGVGVVEVVECQIPIAISTLAMLSNARFRVGVLPLVETNSVE
jgi:hypothetical protein